MDLTALARIIDRLRSENLTPDQWRAITLLVDAILAEFGRTETPDHVD